MANKNELNSDDSNKRSETNQSEMENSDLISSNNDNNSQNGLNKSVEKKFQTPDSSKKSKAGCWIAAIFGCLGLVIIILIILFIFGLAVFKEVEKEIKNSANIGDDAESIINDALEGTNTAAPRNEKYVKLFSELLETVNVETEKKYQNCLVVQEDEMVFEMESFESKPDLQKYQKMLNECIVELENFDYSYTQIAIKMNDIIENNQDLTEREKKSALNELNAFFNDEKRLELIKKQDNALRIYYSEILQVYEYLEDNFGAYSIEKSATGEKEIIFDRIADVTEYNSKILDVTSAESKYLSAHTALVSYINQKWRMQGFDLDVEDVREKLKN